MIDLDGLVLVLDRMEEKPVAPEEGGFLLDFSPLAYKISKATAQVISRNGFSGVYSSDDIAIKAFKNFYQLTLRGKFFLMEDYLEKLKAIFKILIDEKWTFSITRIDIACTFSGDFTAIFNDLQKLDFGSLTVCRFSTKKQGKYLSAYNSRFAFVGYCKSTQLSRNKSSTKAIYETQFYKKYPNLKNILISRLEVRLKGSDSCSPYLLALTQGKFFEVLQQQFIPSIEKRVKLSRKLKKELKKYSFLFQGGDNELIKNI